MTKAQRRRLAIFTAVPLTDDQLLREYVPAKVKVATAIGCQSFKELRARGLSYAACDAQIYAPEQERILWNYQSPIVTAAFRELIQEAAK